MSGRSFVTGIICVVLALLCVPFVLCGSTEQTVGGGVSWIIILLGLSLFFFARASFQAKREQADRELMQELLPNEADRRGEP